jgi:hypothetical protein
MRNSTARRTAWKLAFLNGGIWGVGSGLANVTLLTYFARQAGATGVAIGWLIAAPSLVGLLRLATPAWTTTPERRRRFCLGAFGGSALAAAAIPAGAFFGDAAHGGRAVAVLTAAWTAQQLLEFFGVAAMWDWWADLAPERLRGRFIGRREAWLTAGAVAGMVLGVAFVWLWERRCRTLGANDELWKGYAACAWWGAGAFAAAILPLARIPELRRRGAKLLPPLRWRDLVDPWRSPAFRRLLVYGVWLSATNGLVQTAQSLFMISPLNVSYAWKKTYDGVSRGVQSLLLPGTGRWIDRRGAIRILAASHGVVALAAAFFLVASESRSYWIVGAYVLWLAYAGINVAAPRLMLGHSPPERTTTYAAAWFGWTQLAFAVCALLGGWIYDWLGRSWKPVDVAGWSVDRFALIFAVSLALKLVGVPLALRIPEASKDG